MSFGQAVKAILERVGDLFDIFDLSFFVSGALLFGAVVFAITLVEPDGNDGRRTDLTVAVDQAQARVAEAERALDLATEQWRTERDVDIAAKLDTLRREALTALGASREALDASRRALAVFESNRPALVRFAEKTTTPLAILGIYILGLLCFAVGRLWLGQSRRTTELERTIASHGLTTCPHLKDYCDRKAWNELYTRLWAWLRESGRRESYTLLRRYWILTAVYDGVSVALIVWIPFAWIGMPKGLGALGAGMGAVLLVLAVLCKREAARYRSYQIREIVATYAHDLDNPSGGGGWDTAGPAGGGIASLGPAGGVITDLAPGVSIDLGQPPGDMNAPG